jgi:hypothetical protein
MMAIAFSSQALAADTNVGGVWTKTTHPDIENIVIIYSDGQVVRAIGYGRIADRPAIWYAEGNCRDRHVKLTYRYSPDSTPAGWEPEGTMQLKLSEDWGSMTGSATSRSGNWSDRIELRRVLNPK